MSNLIVVDNPKTWTLSIPGVPLVAAKTYLMEPPYTEIENAKVFNLCRSYRYQTAGYYVSLLAMARGHKPLPSIATIQDMKTSSMVRLASEDLQELIDAGLKPVHSSSFTLSIYFGHNLAKRYDELSSRLFRMFACPLLRAEFGREEDGWRLQSIRPIAGNDVPESHREFVVTAALGFFAQRRFPHARRPAPQYDIAILRNKQDKTRPSNDSALRKFAKAARRLRMGVELIEREDFGRLAEFDALFIRETTSVNHYTYRFARKAAAEGLVVIDDPDSITKCANKVYLAELLDRHNIPHPKTLIVHRDNRDEVLEHIGLPCILKQPDSYFSLGVVKVEDAATLDAEITRLLEISDLVIAQEFVPTDFDWRIGVLDRRPLFACKYFMADRHWQIARSDANGDRDYGRVEAVPLEHVPVAVLNTALKAAKLIGDGLYGVDLKELDERVGVIEVNDNPNIDTGFEDRVLKDELYERIMRVFLARIQQRKEAGGLYPP
ncbi:MAG TPA: RimK family protein [Phycisphaerae bacterium]|nr:RimK family protein [Phycisphaerae bacterium]